MQTGDSERVIVQPIQVQQAAAGGGAAATVFGTSAQQDIIEGLIDSVWAQAGIDVKWLSTQTLVDSFAYDGNPNDYRNGATRPSGDLNLITS